MTTDAERDFDAVVFDYGGVFSASPHEGMSRGDQVLGLPPGTLVELLGFGFDAPEPEPGAPYTNGWQQLEVDEITFEEYGTWVAERSVAITGRPLTVGEVFAAGFGGGMGVFWPMVHQAMHLKQAGYRLAICTNNAVAFRDGWKSQVPLELFDVIVDSSEVRLRKPDPRIYELVGELLGVALERSVFIDDHPRNVAAAASLGMRAIHVTDPMVALDELQQVTGVGFGSGPVAG
jgi:epoxide hydrolase-like predicted phosphatase